ncbi:MAG: fibronectin type III domain-containing protein [Alphaproteobacteria bacterium]
MLRYCLVVLALTPVVLATPQAYAQEQMFGVRSIAEVTDGELPAATEVTHRDAVLRFRSSIPLACSVVYGETTAFGHIAVDQDMDGGAHQNHHPLMANLRPNTTYHFRVQGVAADGRVFVGETQTFRTLAAPRDTRVNIASLLLGPESRQSRAIGPIKPTMDRSARTARSTDSVARHGRRTATATMPISLSTYQSAR